MHQRITLLCLLIQAIVLTGWAQTTDKGKSIHLPDSAKRDFEEWLRHAPPQAIVRDSSILQPLPPELPLGDPQKQTPEHPQHATGLPKPLVRRTTKRPEGWRHDDRCQSPFLPCLGCPQNIPQAKDEEATTPRATSADTGQLLNRIYSSDCWYSLWDVAGEYQNLQSK